MSSCYPNTTAPVLQNSTGNRQNMSTNHGRNSKHWELERLFNQFIEYVEPPEDQPICCICRVGWDSQHDDVVRGRHCSKHAIHYECLLHWLKCQEDDHKKCPLCRRTVVDMKLHIDVARLVIQSWVAFALEEESFSRCQDSSTLSASLEKIITNVVARYHHTLTLDTNSFWEGVDVHPELVAEYGNRFRGDISWVWLAFSEDAIRVATLDALINFRQHEYQYLDWSDFYDSLYDDVIAGSKAWVARQHAQNAMLSMRTPQFLCIFHERRRLFEEYFQRDNAQTTVLFTGANLVGFTIRVDDEFERLIEPDSARFIRRDENGQEIYRANHLGRGGSNGWVTGNDAQPDFRMVLNADDYGEYLFEICLSWELLDRCGAIELRETEKEARIRFVEPPGTPAGETNEWIFDTSPKWAEDWFVPALFNLSSRL